MGAPWCLLNKTSACADTHSCVTPQQLNEAWARCRSTVGTTELCLANTYSTWTFQDIADATTSSMARFLLFYTTRYISQNLAYAPETEGPSDVVWGTISAACIFRDSTLASMSAYTFQGHLVFVCGPDVNVNLWTHVKPTCQTDRSSM